MCCDGRVKPPAGQVTVVKLREALTAFQRVNRKSGGGGGPPQTFWKTKHKNKINFNMTSDESESESMSRVSKALRCFYCFWCHQLRHNPNCSNHSCCWNLNLVLTFHTFTFGHCVIKSNSVSTYRLLLLVQALTLIFNSGPQKVPQLSNVYLTRFKV